MVIATLIAVGTLLTAMPESFESREYSYTGGKFQQKPFQYRLFVPRVLEPDERYPLLVWLHGFGDGGEDNKRHLIVVDTIPNENSRFFILAVQCPSVHPIWFDNYGDVGSSAAKPDDMLAVAVEVLHKTIQEYPIDTDRVYVAGISTGGSGCWEMALRYPELYAAAVPMGSPKADASRAAKLVNMPVWAFHNRDDHLTPSEQSQQMVAVVKAAGGCIHLTQDEGERPMDGHNCWTAAIEEHHFMDWMLAQCRGDWIHWTPPLCRPWQWWHILTLPCALLAFVRLAWHVEQRRRRRTLESAETDDADFSVGPLLAECDLVESAGGGFENRESTGTSAG